MKSDRKIVRRILSFFPFLIILIIIIRCEEEKPVPREYPRLTATSVINISDSGATFTADLYSIGTEVIEEYGFVWDVYGELSYQNSNKLILGKPENTGVFTANVCYALIKNRKYNARPYVKTSDRIVYGPLTTFVSLGGKAPVIYGFYPDSGGWGDTIKISGRNFSWIASSHEVFLNDVPCKPEKSTDTTLTFVIDTKVLNLKNAISVSLAGNTTTFIKDSLKLIPPYVTDFNPKNGYWGDTVRISGKYLGFLYNTLPVYTIKLGNQKCTVIGSFADTLVIVKVPFEINTVSNNLVLNINGFILNCPSPFNLLPPYFSFSPAEGTFGSKLSLTGRFNTIKSRNKVLFNKAEATILSVGLNTIQVSVPTDVTDISPNLIYKVTPFEITSTNQFKLKPPIITSFNPLSGPSGTKVTIRGKYFGINLPVVKFGDITGSVTSVNDSVIVINVPAGGFGPVKVSVTVAGQTVVSESEFDLKNPRITAIAPLTGTFNDEITITGVNFRPSETGVFFGYYAMQPEIISKSETTIKIRVPNTLDSIPRSIYVFTGWDYTTSEQKFTLTPPEITSVTPPVLQPGADVVISGKNFNPEAIRNTVMIDMTYLSVKSATPNQIVATFAALPRGDFKLKVVVGGYSRKSNSVFQINSQLKRIEAPLISTQYTTRYNEGVFNYGAGIKNYGYVASHSMRKTYKFDPLNNSWQILNINYCYSDWQYPEFTAKTILGDTLYLIAGRFAENPNTKLFDPATNRWRAISGPASSYGGVAFTLNNKLYFGLDYNYLEQNFFYECDPSSNYSWTRKGDFPTSIPASFSSSFSIMNKGFVVFSNNEVWQFNPDSNTWSRKSDFPGIKRQLALSFTIGNDAYFGTGRSVDGALSDIWKYDFVTDSWTMVMELPGSRYSALAFSLNGKAYIGFGLKYLDNHPTDLYDFYEFDPNYPMK
jgi:hypothetical protein